MYLLVRNTFYLLLNMFFIVFSFLFMYYFGTDDNSMMFDYIYANTSYMYYILYVEDLSYVYIYLYIYIDIVINIISSLIFIIMILICVAYFTLLERKILGGIQRRRGPNYFGFFGILQPLGDVKSWAYFWVTIFLYWIYI